MNEKLIITGTVVAFIIATLFLASALQRQFATVDYWSVAFVAPQDSTDYRFTITNNTDTVDFSYTIISSITPPSTPITLTIPSQTQQTIAPNILTTSTTAPITINFLHDNTTHVLKK